MNFFKSNSSFLLSLLFSVIFSLGIGYWFGQSTASTAASPARVQTTSNQTMHISNPMSVPIIPPEIPPSTEKNKFNNQEVIKDAQRYKALIELYRANKGSMPFSLSYTLEPNKKMVEFLQLSENELNQIRQVSRDTFARIQQWEKQNAKIVEQNDQVLAYEITGNPEFIAQEKGNYLSAIRDIIGENSVFFETLSQEFFDTLQSKRNLKYSIKGDQYTFEVKSNRGGSTMNGTLNNQPPQPFVERYSHLFTPVGTN